MVDTAAHRYTSTMCFGVAHVHKTSYLEKNVHKLATTATTSTTTYTMPGKEGGKAKPLKVLYLDSCAEIASQRLPKHTS